MFAGSNACVSSGWCIRVVVVVENKGILKKVNLRQLHLDTLLSFPKAISRRTKLGIAPEIWRGKKCNPCSMHGIRRLVTHGFVIISKDHCYVSSAQTLCVCVCMRVTQREYARDSITLSIYDREHSRSADPNPAVARTRSPWQNTTFR